MPSGIVRPASGSGVANLWSTSEMTTKVDTISAGASVTIKASVNNAYQINYAMRESYPTNGKTIEALNMRTGPSQSDSLVTLIPKGATVKVTGKDASTGWYAVTYSNSGGQYWSGYCASNYITLDKPGGDAWIAKADVNETTGVTTIETNTAQVGDYAATVDDPHLEIEESTNYQEQLDAETAFVAEMGKQWGNYTYGSTQTQNHDYFMDKMRDLNYAFGVPPKYNMDVDVQYDGTTTNGIGRVMSSTVYSNSTILSICPGKVKLFPDLFGVKKDEMMEKYMRAVQGMDLESKIQNDDNAKFTGKMYTFSQDTVGFSKRVNALCRGAAILLGIGDEKIPYTQTMLKDFDYSYWAIRKMFTPMAESNFLNVGIFGQAFKAAADGFSSGVKDTNYIHFVCSNSATQVSESMTNTTGPNAIMQSLQTTVNSATSTLAYFLGTGFNETADFSEAITSGLQSALGINGWSKLADNLMKGGQMVFPDQITEVNYSQAVSCSLNFVSPYGDPLSVFLWCIVPTLHLLALTLPKQVADNMYTFPHICRVCQKGWFNSNLCVLSDLNITRGGGDDTSWTVDGLATDWVVSFSIIPLITQLMVTSTDNPFLFMKNDGLIDYLGNLCSFDLKASNLEEKFDIFKTFTKNRVIEPFSMNRISLYLSDTLNSKIRDIFRLG